MGIEGRGGLRVVLRGGVGLVTEGRCLLRLCVHDRLELLERGLGPLSGVLRTEAREVGLRDGGSRVVLAVLGGQVEGHVAVTAVLRQHILALLRGLAECAMVAHRLRCVQRLGALHQRVPEQFLPVDAVLLLDGQALLDELLYGIRHFRDRWELKRLNSKLCATKFTFESSFAINSTRF